VDRALDDGDIVRTHVMRPTWHFVAPEDLRWLLALTAPRVRQASAYQYRLLEIDARLAGRARDVIVESLKGGAALTRDELGQRLRESGIDATGIRLAYLVGDAELETVICSGPRRGKRQTYALVDERIPPAAPRTREEALGELGRRYVEGHGPAQAADLAWWSGLTMADARVALDLATPPLVREPVGERTFWASPSSPAPRFDSPTVHLLPNYDELLIAFRDRGDAVDRLLPPPARVAEVVIAHVLARDGLVVGGWRRVQDRAIVRLEATPMVPLESNEGEAFRRASERFAAFLGRPVEMVGLD
jgi:hypothetical protein